MAIAAKTRRAQPEVSAPVAALAGMPAGPALCTALAQIDPAVVTGYEMVLVLRARGRQGNYERGMFLAAVAETVRRTDSEHGVLAEHELGDRRAWNIGELRAALVLTRTAANSLGALAHDLAQRLPAVLAAMVTGAIDQPKARVFSSWTEQLADRHAQTLVEHLLPIAPRLTTGELIEAIQRKAIELDPRWARRRYERALQLRQVKGTLRPDGTADLTGTNLPADQVATACDRIDALAHRLKQAGYPSLLTWIRADLYLGKLDGRYEGLTDEQLFAHLMANSVPQPAPDPEPKTPDDDRTPEEIAEYYDYLVDHGLIDPDEFDDDVADDPPSEGPESQPEHDRWKAEGGEAPPDEPKPPPEDPPAEAPPAENEPPADEPPAEDLPAGDLPTTEPPVQNEPPADEPPAESRAGGMRGRGMRLLVGLGTLAGADRRPGELLGFGFVHAELARRISAATAASWFYALVEPDGTPIAVGPVRGRPTRPWVEGDIPDCRHLEVWLQVTRDELARLTHDPPPGWPTILTNRARHIAVHRVGAPNADPTARLPGAPLRRWISIRDRRCVFPGCRVAPHRTDADHTIEHARGGPTIDTNVGCACEPDHMLRHEHGWRVRQPEPGQFIWTSPLGHEYQRNPPPGPGEALAPMTRPTRHCEDRTLIWVNGDIAYRGTETCKTIIEPPPPPPPPLGDPPF
jgi:hypothetical protein